MLSSGSRISRGEEHADRNQENPVSSTFSLHPVKPGTITKHPGDGAPPESAQITATSSPGGGGGTVNPGARSLSKVPSCSPTSCSWKAGVHLLTPGMWSLGRRVPHLPRGCVAAFTLAAQLKKRGPKGSPSRPYPNRHASVRRVRDVSRSSSVEGGFEPFNWCYPHQVLEGWPLRSAPETNEAGELAGSRLRVQWSNESQRKTGFQAR